MKNFNIIDRSDPKDIKKAEAAGGEERDYQESLRQKGLELVGKYNIGTASGKAQFEALTETLRDNSISYEVYSTNDRLFNVFAPKSQFETIISIRHRIFSEKLGISYQEMASDEEREAEAEKFAEGVTGDVSDENDK